METKGKAERAASDFLRLVTRPFIVHPDGLDIGVVELRTESTITMRPHAEDYGYLNGKKGAMLDALCILVRQVGHMVGRHLRLVLLRSVDGAMSERRQFQRAERWDNRHLHELTLKACSALLPPVVRVTVEDKEDLSVVRIYCGRLNEDSRVAARVEQALGTLLLSVGKGMGRNNTLVELSEGKENK